MKQIEDKRS